MYSGTCSICPCGSETQALTDSARALMTIARSRRVSRSSPRGERYVMVTSLKPSLASCRPNGFPLR